MTSACRASTPQEILMDQVVSDVRYLDKLIFLTHSQPMSRLYDVKESIDLIRMKLDKMYLEMSKDDLAKTPNTETDRSGWKTLEEPGGTKPKESQ